MPRTIKDDDPRAGKKKIKTISPPPDPQRELVKEVQKMTLETIKFAQGSVNQIREMTENITKIISQLGPIKVDVTTEMPLRNFRHKVLSRDGKGFIKEVETIEAKK